MAGLNYELATRFADRALEQQADHPAALEMRALIAQQTGDFERGVLRELAIARLDPSRRLTTAAELDLTAQGTHVTSRPPISDSHLPQSYFLILAEALLRRSIEVEPNQGARRYMYLGQMLTGEEAANALGKGIELLAAEAQTVCEIPQQKSAARRFCLTLHGFIQLAQQGEQYHDEVAQLHSDIAAGFCSLAEVYLTDLWCVGIFVEYMNVRPSSLPKNMFSLSFRSDVEDAQETCLTLMGKALEYDPHNPQTLQVRDT